VGYAFGHAFDPRPPPILKNECEAEEWVIYLAKTFEQRWGLINNCLRRPDITFWKVQGV
jgi:hypothetical protein